MKPVLVSDKIGPLYLTLRKQSPGIVVGDGAAQVFLPSATRLIQQIPEECWEFGLERVYADPITFERQPEGGAVLVPELIGSSTLTNALVLLQLELDDVDFTRFEAQAARIVAWATACGHHGFVEQMLVVMRPEESVKAVGYRAGSPVNTCSIHFDGAKVTRSPVENYQ